MPVVGQPVAPGYFGIDPRAVSPFSPLGGDVANGPAGVNRMGQFMPGLRGMQDGMTMAPPAESELQRIARLLMAQ